MSFQKLVTKTGSGPFDPDLGLVLDKGNDLAVEGGLYSYIPDYGTLALNGSAKPQPLIPVLLTVPLLFNTPGLPSGTEWARMLKAIIETHAHSITGITSGVNVDSSERAVDGSGRMLSEVQDVTEEISKPIHAIYEQEGYPFFNYVNGYIRLFMKDPVSKHAGIVNLPGIDRNTLPAIGIGSYGFTVMYIQPNSTRSRAEKVIIQTGCYFNTSGAWEMQRVVDSQLDTPEWTFELGGTPLPESPNIMRLANEYLNALEMVGAATNQKTSFVNGIAGSIDASLRGSPGYAESLIKNSDL